jgi:hypothetical protein
MKACTVVGNRYIKDTSAAPFPSYSNNRKKTIQRFILIVVSEHQQGNEEFSTAQASHECE